MGFLKVHHSIEGWLQTAAVSFRALSQKEYKDLVAEWRVRFERLLVSREFIAGRAAERAAEDALPTNVVIFRLPGYRWLPAGTDARFDAAYAYRATRLRFLDFSVANAADAVIADEDLTFTCLCTHEAGSMTQVQFCQVHHLR